MSAYCPTCRADYGVEDNPPYSVIHVIEGGHLHPITREEVS